MKRHPNFLNLSREHHTALRLARDAKRAADSGDTSEIQRLAQQVGSLFIAELDVHFRTEEGGLLISLAQAGEHGLVRRTLAEHEALRNLVAALQQPDAQTLRRFAELMTAHVRFEERELFKGAQSLAHW